MNSNLLKKLLAVAITGLFLVSVGVSAAEKAKCKPDQTWNPQTKKCETTTPK